MAFNLNKEFDSLLKKHSAFFDQMCGEGFCALSEFGFYCVKYVTTSDAFFYSLPHEAKIAVCGIGAYTQALLRALNPANRNRIAWYTRTDVSQENVMFQEQRVITPGELRTKDVDFIILSSNDFRSEMRENLLKTGFQENMFLEIKSTLSQLADLQDGSRAKGCQNCGYSCLLNAKTQNATLSSLYRYYESSPYFNHEHRQMEALYSLIAGFIIARDIVNIRHFSRVYIEKKHFMYDLLELYIKDLNELMDRTFRLIHERKKDAVIIYMLDSYEYEYLEHMPNLKALYQQSLVFNNAFTQYGYTTSSLQVMFTGKDLIDEKAYEIDSFTYENSPLLRTIKNNGYQLHVFRSDGRSKLFSECSDIITHQTQNTASSNYFEMLAVLSASDEKQILYTHMFETHIPFPSPFNHQSDRFTVFETTPSYSTFEMIARSLSYMDEQFHVFDSFLPQGTTKIVMSDHGTGHLLIPKRMVTKELYEHMNKLYDATRVTLFVNASHIQPGFVQDLFCLKNFNGFMDFLWGGCSLASLATPYIKLQRLPTYDAQVFKKLSKLRLPARGIIDKNGVYVYAYNGKEEYYPNKFSNHIDDPEFSDEVKKMRAICGKEFYGLFEQPKFALSKIEYQKRGLFKKDS